MYISKLKKTKQEKSGAWHQYLGEIKTSPFITINLYYFLHSSHKPLFSFNKIATNIPKWLENLSNHDAPTLILTA